VPPSQGDDLAGRCAALLDTSAQHTVIASLTAGRLRGLWLPDSVDERIHVATATPQRAGRLMTRSQRPELIAHRFQLRPTDYEFLRASSRRHNAKRAYAALELLDERSRSRPESHLRVAISGPGMPRFEVNVAIYRSEGGWLAEPDLSLKEARLALEYQGADHAALKRMRKDITRFTDMRRDEWLTIPYGPAEVFGQPYLIKPEIRHLIGIRAPQLLVACR